MLSVIDPTKLSIINILLSAIKLTLRLILLDWKQNKISYAFIVSSTWTVKVIIKLTQTIVPSRGIILIKSNTQKDIRSFVIVKASQFAQLWIRVYDFKKLLTFFTECLKEQNSHWYYNKVVSTPNHLDWLIFSRPLVDDYNHLSIITYINM